jgi:hypothetical protein
VDFMTADFRILTARGDLRAGGRDSYLLPRIPLLIGAWSAKLPDIASAARRDALVQIHLVTLLVLTSSAQVRKEPRPIPAPPLASNVVHVQFATNGGVHTLSLVEPAPPTSADEEGEQPPSPLAGVPRPFNLKTMVVERENFDRWLFAGERTEGER